LKSGSLPAKADSQKQSWFYHTILKPLMDRAKKGEISLLYADASHFVMGCDFLGYIYGRTRRLVKTFSGRKRYNVLGALDFITKKLTTVTNASYITACEVCELFRKIAASYAGKTVFVVLDNARYQKCGLTTDVAARLGINLVFIPPYSPNLNLIERLWKFTKGKLRSRYYNQFEVFREQIDSIVNSTDNLNKEIADRLIGEKVQLFDDLIAVNENSFTRNQRTA
jgi:transposase